VEREDRDKVGKKTKAERQAEQAGKEEESSRRLLGADKCRGDIV
jgi:hypothetical protein